MFDLSEVYPHLALWNERVSMSREYGDDFYDDSFGCRGLGLHFRAWKAEAAMRIVKAKGFCITQFSSMFEVDDGVDDPSLLWNRFV